MGAVTPRPAVMTPRPVIVDPRRESEATALPPPPKLARFESSSRHEAFVRPAVLSLQAESTAKSSNPLFPRVLPDQGFDLFTAVESYQNNLIRQALARKLTTPRRLTEAAADGPTATRDLVADTLGEVRR